VAHEPTDAELARYFERRLAELDDWADDDFSADSIARHRDLWALRYNVDHACPPNGEEAK
jgi:hypothetical protein